MAEGFKSYHKYLEHLAKEKIFKRSNNMIINR